MSSLNAFEAPPRSSRVPTRLLPRTLAVPGATHGAPAASPSAPTATPSGKVQEVMRLAPRIPASAPARPSSPRTGMLAIVATPPPAPTKAPPPSRGIAGRVLAALLLMALAAAGVFVYQRERGSSTPHPSAWDPLVLPVVRFVEHARGLVFAHPVYVDLLSDTDYARAVATLDTGGDTQPVDRRDLANAFGLATGFDATAAAATLAPDSTHGTYRSSTGRILLRGTELTPGVRVVLAHELTHALQAQHFALHLGGADDLATRSIAEADATRVANAYLASLTTDEQSAATTANALGAPEAEALARVPWPMVELRFAPYWLGPALVNGAAATGGNTAVDELFRHVPTDIRLISPWRRPPATSGETPTVHAPTGSTILHAPATLSVLQVLVMLDAWLPWTVARTAVDHWVDGSYVAYREGGTGTMCVDAAIALDAPTTPLTDALASWAAVAGSPSRPVAEGRTVRFTACDRGPAAANPPAPVLGPSTELLLEQSAVTAAGAADPAAITAALCVERTLIDNPAAAPILALPAPSPDQQAVVDLSRAAARQTCGV